MIMYLEFTITKQDRSHGSKDGAGKGEQVPPARFVRRTVYIPRRRCPAIFDHNLVLGRHLSPSGREEREREDVVLSKLMVWR